LNEVHSEAVLFYIQPAFTNGLKKKSLILLSGHLVVQYKKFSNSVFIRVCFTSL
jgi:hypothetical protein